MRVGCGARPGRLLLRRDPAHREAARPRDPPGARLFERRRGDPPGRPRAGPGRAGMSLEQTVHTIASQARAASERIAELGTREKDAWLLRSAERLEAAKSRILAANAEDLAEARRSGVAEPLVNRLELSAGKWRDMLAGLRDVAALPDPVGSVENVRVRPNGLRVGRMRIPLGVIGIIYESRPNVTVDAAALCLKAGNAVILRGGSEAIRANLALAGELREAARETGVPEDAIGI